MISVVDLIVVFGSHRVDCFVVPAVDYILRDEKRRVRRCKATEERS